MNRLLTVLFIAFFGSSTYAQDSLEVDVDTIMAETVSLENANFHFVYIDHEPTTPVGELCSRLTKLYNDALETGDRLIVYLSNEDQPFISFTNLKDPFPDMHRDSLGYFDNIIDELQGVNYHDVYSAMDLETIKDIIGIDGKIPLFEEVDYEGRMRFKSVTMDFYIGKRFWALHYNEAIIANLFVSLQIPTYMKKYPITQLSFNVFKPQADVLEHPEGMPFGKHDLGRINETVNILEY